MGPGNDLEDVVLILDTPDGGIEAWIGLPPVIMNHLDHDPNFLAHVSLAQTVSGPESAPPLSIPACSYMIEFRLPSSYTKVLDLLVLYFSTPFVRFRFSKFPTSSEVIFHFLF
ncbi:unnamed protein product [Cuscuta epithymum]|uniref:Uncharacterized protein n=1 Tax=Cuscuta epithymum TaxID=186058 RepID=A0AAV0FTI8_9ASTE|nr:unnamed protein product [Cuscuta epithymum]